MRLPRTRAFRPCNFALALALVAATIPAVQAQVTLKIRNFSGQQVWVMWTGTSSLTGTSNGTSIASSDYGVNAAGYDLATFNEVEPQVYQVDNFTMGGGRMWFTYGSQSWTFQSTGYTPSLANFNDPNFPLRFDKIEAYIVGSSDDNLDMTAVDAFSIPFAVEAYNANNKAATTQTLNGSLGRTIYKALAAVAGNSKAAAPKTPPGAESPLPHITGNSPYLFINANSQGTDTGSPYQDSPIGSTGSFVRVIANDNRVYRYAGDPVALANNDQVPANYNWPTYDNYVRRMDGRAASKYTGTTKLAGNFAGVSAAAAGAPPVYTSALTSPATYALTANFDSTEQRTVTYYNGSTPHTYQFQGWVTLKGTSTIASGTYAGTYNVEVKIPYGGLPEYYTVISGAYQYAFMLDPSGVVGANANYLYKYYPQGASDPGWSQTDLFNGGPQNNLLTWVEGDLFAGMNVGSLGSDKTLKNAVTINGNTYPAGTKIGTFASQDWFSLGSVMVAAAGSGSVYDYYFGFLQTDSDLYNKYAETVYPLTEAYGFAYSDRIAGGRVAISWNATVAGAIDTVVITILPDTGTPLLTSAGAVDAIEYHNASLDHYFMTWAPDEIARLDAGTVIRGWARTGRVIRAFPAPQTGTTPMCRYYIPPAQGNSHFFGRSPAECAATAAKFPAFQLEDPAFMHMVMPAAGACPAGTTPVYRVFSNRPDANHRHVNDLGTRSQLEARGWLAEGDGPGKVVLCAPQ